MARLRSFEFVFCKPGISVQFWLYALRGTAEGHRHLSEEDRTEEDCRAEEACDEEKNDVAAWLAGNFKLEVVSSA